MAALLRFLPLLMACFPSAHAGADVLMRRETESIHSEDVGNVRIHKHVQLDTHRPKVDEDIVNALVMGEGSKERGTSKGELESCECFHMNAADGSDECEKGHDMPVNEEKCMLAADLLGLEKGEKMMLDIDAQNPLPYPKGCFLNATEDPPKVYLNPSGADSSFLTLSGKKICMRPLYTNGTANKPSEESCKGLPEDYVPILEYDACLLAMTSCAGGAAPKLDPFFYNVTPAKYAPANMPDGCFRRIDTGEWAFNWIHKLGGKSDEHVATAGAASICYDSTANSENTPAAS